MLKKWFITLMAASLSMALLAGCNNDNDDLNPPPPPNTIDETPIDDVDRNDHLPGVDENDTMLKDDEDDLQPDPEDVVEDVEDMRDADNKDE